MPRKPVLDIPTLAALGPEKLARLVLGEAERNAPFRKLVNAALAGAKGPEAVAKQVDRRLAALEKAKGYIDRQKERAFAADLDATLRVIADGLAEAPAIAIDCLLRSIAAHEGVFDRVDDSAGRVQRVYEDAVEAFAELVAKLPEEERRRLPDRIQPLLADDGHRYGGELALASIPLLPPDALAGWDARLGEEIGRLEERAKAKPTGRQGASRGSTVVAGVGDMRALEAAMSIRSLVTLRQTIAEARGDLDAQVRLEEAKAPQFRDPAGMAARLLNAGRAEQALDWVRRADSRQGIGHLDREGRADGIAVQRFGASSRPLLEATILDVLGRMKEAQALRWSAFEAGLDADALRAHVAHLGDFEEFDVLDRAFAHVRRAKERYRALSFFLRWPRTDLAAQHVLAHADSWDGRHYELLGEAAEILEEDFPLAAAVLYRALLTDILSRSKSRAYGHGARYLGVLDALEAKIPADGFSGASLAGHEAFREGLRRGHGRKAAFWSQVAEPARGQVAQARDRR